MSGNKPELAAPSVPARRAGLLVLIAGGVISAAAAFGPIWAVRAGIGVALLAGIVACVLAWRHAKQVQEARIAQELTAMRRRAAIATETRQRHEDVLDTLNDRHAEMRLQLRELRIKHADLLIALNALRGDKTALAADIERATDEIAALREQVSLLEAQLPEDLDAEVLSLPRRVGRSTPQHRVATDSDQMPTVIDLQALALPLVEEVRRDHA